jgi:hypothetical protein
MVAKWNPWLLVACVTLSAGCHSPALQDPPLSAKSAESLRQSNEGYSLLHQLMSDESNVGKLFILKRTSSAVSAPVKEIAAAAQAAQKQLDEFRKQDSRLKFDTPGLPDIEERSRDLQATASRNALLTSSGKEFEATLIYTQMQATGYAVQLCRALQEREADPTRKIFLVNLANQCQAFHDRLAKLWSVNN